MLLILCLLIFTNNTNAFRVLLNLKASDGPICFYQYLMRHEKYVFNIQPYGHLPFRAIVNYKAKDIWQQLINKQHQVYELQINKMAIDTGLYMFCVVSYDFHPSKIRIKLISGVELIDFQTLPKHEDNQQILQTIAILQQQKQRLIEYNNRYQDFSQASQRVSESMNRWTKVAIILGILVVIGVNYCLFIQTKRIFNERKLM